MKNWGRAISLILALAVLLKLIYVMIFFAPSYSQINWDHELKWYESAETQHDLNRLIIRNDGGFYEGIAKDGYPKLTLEHRYDGDPLRLEQGKFAFFPLVPSIIDKMMSFVGLTFEQAANIYALIISLLLFVLFYLFALNWLESKRQALYATMLLMVFPFHFYFSALYTEATFLLLLIGAFYSIRTHNFALFVVSIVLLPLVRVNGILMALPIILFLLEQNGGLKLNTKYLLFGGITCVIMFMSFLILTGYFNMLTGDYFAFNTVQKYWGKEFTFPFSTLGDNIATNPLQTGYTIFFILLAIWGVNKMPWSFNMLIWISLLLPLTAGSVQSMPRYISVIFPFFLLLGKRIPEKFTIPSIVALAALHLWSFTYWIVGSPLSY